MPVDLTPADLESAEKETILMPAFSAAAAAEVEDQEFWGRIHHLQDDQDIAFWEELHAAVTESRAYVLENATDR